MSSALFLSGAPSVSASQLHELMRGEREIAVIDVREARSYATGHIALSSHNSLSFLEPSLTRSLPRQSVLVVLVDDDGGEGVGLARQKLVGAGFSDVRILAGGIKAWRGVGFAIATGYGALVKGFADLAHARYETPTITPSVLSERLSAGLPTTVVDCRPTAEYRSISIAGAHNAPGVDLLSYDFNARSARGHLWVISCFSRTRGILGTTSLALLAGRKDVAFLEDGIMAAVLQGVPTEPGRHEGFPVPRSSGASAAELARSIISRFGLRVIDRAEYRAFKVQATERTLYVFDVRHESEYAAAHLPGVVSAPGGQLAMTCDIQIPVRRARVVLVDSDDLLRAAVTAFWLGQLTDTEIYILDDAEEDFVAEATEFELPREVEWISPEALADKLETGSVRVLDVGPSLSYEQGHIPGAGFMLRAQWPTWSRENAQPGHVVFTSPDGANAAYAAAQANREGVRASALRGGTAAWQAAGLPISNELVPEHLISPFLDDWGSPMRVKADRETPFREYLAWERALGHSIEADDTVRFRWP